MKNSATEIEKLAFLAKYALKGQVQKFVKVLSDALEEGNQYPTQHRAPIGSGVGLWKAVGIGLEEVDQKKE